MSIAILLFAIIVIGNVNTVGAVFGGSDSPAYPFSKTINPRTFETCIATSSSGECEIEVVNLAWPFAYPEGSQSAAIVGAEYETDQSVTATWYISSSWTLDYKLSLGFLGSATLLVVYYVYDSDEVLLEQKTAWSVTVIGSLFGWDTSSGELDEGIYKSFTVNLENSETYYIVVGLKIILNNATGAVIVCANTDDGNPALLTVDSIVWTLIPPR